MTVCAETLQTLHTWTNISLSLRRNRESPGVQSASASASCPHKLIMTLTFFASGSFIFGDELIEYIWGGLRCDFRHLHSWLRENMAPGRCYGTYLLTPRATSIKHGKVIVCYYSRTANFPDQGWLFILQLLKFLPSSVFSGIVNVVRVRT